MSDLIFKTSQARRSAFAKGARGSIAFLVMIVLVIVAMLWGAGRLSP